MQQLIIRTELNIRKWGVTVTEATSTWDQLVSGQEFMKPEIDSWRLLVLSWLGG